MTPDDHPIVGAVPGVAGLYIAAGFSGHGFMHSPATAQLIVEEMLDGRAHTLDIGDLSLDASAIAPAAVHRDVLYPQDKVHAPRSSTAPAARRAMRSSSTSFLHSRPRLLHRGRSAELDSSPTTSSALTNATTPSLFLTARIDGRRPASTSATRPSQTSTRSPRLVSARTAPSRSVNAPRRVRLALVSFVSRKRLSVHNISADDVTVSRCTWCCGTRPKTKRALPTSALVVLSRTPTRSSCFPLEHEHRPCHSVSPAMRACLPGR